MTQADKETERRRYDDRAAQSLAAPNPLAPLGADGIPEELRRPYLRFASLVCSLNKPGDAVLDLCCGDGQFSFVAASVGARVTGLDFSDRALVLAARRTPEALHERMHWVQGDCEQLPFEDGAFGGVTCAGGLSYGDWQRVRDEIFRVLRPGGWFVAVDSYNHSPIYRFNRWLHRLRGRRTAMVNRRIPNRRWLAQWSERFPGTQVEHFDVLAFLLPLLRLWCDGRQAGCWVEAREPRGRLREWAFKIVVHSRKPG